ncbi:DUF1003 domain-containing protein [Tahibacter amnicola]|uniref:DUF1003 domain-containing protein n=1 Tax=Tahibacter amnicola TaxID=2976241 RepID=A0ABY6BBE9_9GAMM|nr:DUF1003 domain-containing protein [Tahibacter amnicola]UXI66470.1 DUF1003 domain-containing protein [Tahibacter amnicola]
MPASPIASETLVHRSHLRMRCVVCGERVMPDQSWPLSSLRPALRLYLHQSHPSYRTSGRICERDLDQLRQAYIRDSVARERHGSSHAGHDIQAGPEHVTFGERLSDRIAAFGGSWTFLASFGGTLVAWICINSLLPAGSVFDPFPFILLNLALSCLAAIQAPIILMSQNRSAARDRERAEHDYRVNLKAELEIRHLHEKIDHVLHLQNDRSRRVERSTAVEAACDES